MPTEGKLIFGIYVNESDDWVWKTYFDEYSDDDVIELARVLGATISQLLETLQEDSTDDIHIEGTQQKEGGVAS